MSSLFLENFGDFAGYFGNRRNLLCEFVVNDARVMPGRRYLRLSFLGSLTLPENRIDYQQPSKPATAGFFMPAAVKCNTNEIA